MVNPTQWVIRNVHRIPDVLYVPHPNPLRGWMVVLKLWEGGYAAGSEDACNVAYEAAAELIDVVEAAHKSLSLDAPCCEHCGAPRPETGARQKKETQ